MARNLAPKHKASRRFGENVADTVKSPLARRNYPAGVHGPKKSFNKVSEYGKQLMEKQKAKAIYGLLEKQFALTFNKAKRMTGDVNNNLLILLETRLDNVIFRSGLAQTRRLARQLVTHGHFMVDGQKVNIPSYVVKPGQVIKVKENKLNKGYWKNISERIEKVEAAGWISLDAKNFTLTVNSRPNQGDLPKNIATNLIVDFYSR